MQLSIKPLAIEPFSSQPSHFLNQVQASSTH